MGGKREKVRWREHGGGNKLKEAVTDKFGQRVGEPKEKKEMKQGGGDPAWGNKTKSEPVQVKKRKGIRGEEMVGDGISERRMGGAGNHAEKLGEGEKGLRKECKRGGEN